jgi:hypothetical protein
MRQLIIFKNFAIFASLIGSAFMLSSCQTTRTPRAASEYLYSTDKSQTQLLEDLKAKFTENKYEVKTLDIETGFLVTKPRKFNIGNGEVGRQTVQIRQEGGSVKIRSVYECEYEVAGKKDFEPCLIEDSDATQKIQRIDGLLLKIVKDTLNKHTDK